MLCSTTSPIPALAIVKAFTETEPAVSLGPEMRNPYAAMTDLQQGEEIHVAISATGSFVMFVMAAWPALY